MRRTTTVVHWGRQPVHVDGEEGAVVERTRTRRLLSGTVTVLDIGCLGFATDSKEAVLVLPPGTRALPDGDGVRAQGVDIHIGDRISGGTGPWETDQPDDWIREQWPSAPSGCSEVDRATTIDDVELVDAS